MQNNKLKIIGAIILGALIILFVNKNNFLFSSHKYQNLEYNFYYDGPQDLLDDNREGKTETDGSISSTLFIFNPKDTTNNHVTIMRTIQGEKIAVDEFIKNTLSGLPYIGKKTINGVEFDCYGATDIPSVYITTKGNLTYFIAMFNPDDINYFGFLK